VTGAVAIRCPPRARSRLVAAAFGAACLLGLAPAQAKTLGLLFGVSAYPNFPADKQLRAPANDVRRVIRALSARGLPASDFVVLADGVEGTRGAPTRAAILGELDRLAASAERGDLAVVYGSGHGSRQAARAARKSDGLDQLFLPADAAPNASPGAEPFSAAIVSTEFGARLDAIRLKGADVWFILDSCFSGAASRDVEGAVRDKKIDPPQGEASVANALTPDRATPLAEQPAPPPGAGKLVAFYASQPNETAREAALPANLPLAKRSWGSIFTLALAQALERSRGLSYRQTLVEAGRLLRADPSFQARQTPSFEGDGLDAPVPGGAPAQSGATWRVADGVVLAGQLEGLDEGAAIALYATPDAPPEAALARAVITQAQALEARYALAPAGCDPLRAACAGEGSSGKDVGKAKGKEAAYARLLRPAAGAALRLAPPRLAPGVDEPAFAAPARAALETALKGPLAGRVARDEGDPELVAWLTPQGLRLAPAGAEAGALDAGPLVASETFADPARAAAALERALARARQALTLRRLAQAGLGAGALAVTMEARRHGLDASGKCAFKTPGAPIEEGAPLEVCDRLTLTLENRGEGAVLPAVFFLDDGWNLIARRPACPVGLSVADRLEPGKRLSVEIPYHARAISPGFAPAAANGALVIGAPFRPGEAELPNLCGLAAFNDAGPGATRGEGDDLDALLSGATRGGPRLALEASALSLSFWQVRQPTR
jgi:hypothetical protein